MDFLQIEVRGLLCMSLFIAWSSIFSPETSLQNTKYKFVMKKVVLLGCTEWYDKEIIFNSILKKYFIIFYQKNFFLRYSQCENDTFLPTFSLSLSASLPFSNSTRYLFLYNSIENSMLCALNFDVFRNRKINSLNELHAKWKETGTNIIGIAH